MQYIGRSKRCLASRIAQHLPQKLINRGVSPAQKTAISEHVLDTLHSATSANFSILFKARSEKMMGAYEALAIQMYKPKLNQQKFHTHDIKLFAVNNETQEGRHTNDSCSVAYATTRAVPEIGVKCRLQNASNSKQ